MFQPVNPIQKAHSKRIASTAIDRTQWREECVLSVLPLNLANSDNHLAIANWLDDQSYFFQVDGSSGEELFCKGSLEESAIIAKTTLTIANELGKKPQ